MPNSAEVLEVISEF